MNSRFREEERMRLIALIQEWNLSRIDLFSLSEPNQNLEFFGVMRFYYQDEGEKVSTKCIRVSSTASASDVIEILVEKFRPDMRMLTRAEYSLYEVHINGDERRLLDHERPLLIQLNWGKDDREGRFLLKKEIERSSSSLGRLSSSTSELSTATSNGSFKRKLSKKEKKELKKKEKEDKIKQLASRGSENEGGVASDQKGAGVAEKLYSELPESSFTRSISNPELVMRKRRQLKLERKFQDMNSPDGAKGGTLKIYGQSIKPDIPYKTLLVSANDTVAQVVCEALEKYGYENEDPDHFCLVMVMVPPDGNENNKEVRERVMDDDEYPLNILQQHPPSKGDCFMIQNLAIPGSEWLIKFHLRLRPPDAPIRRRQDNRINKSMDSNYSLDSWSNNNNNNDSQQQMSYLVPIAADGRELTNSERIIVPYGMLEVGRGRTHPSNLPFFCLTAPDILPQHCSLTRSAGGATWITPANHEAATVFIQNQRIREPTQINNGQVMQIGKSYFFRYLDTRVPSTIQNSNYVTIGNINKYNNNNNANHLRSPSSSSGSTTRPGKDFETTFDLDGQVLTVPSHGPIGNKNSNNNNEALVEDVYNKNAYNVGSTHLQQFKSNFKPVDNLLPANFILPDGHEDAFLRECIAEVNFAAMQFKMSPSFLVYLSVRSMLRSSSSPPDVDQKINNFSARMSQLINKSVKENMGNPPLLSFWLANASELKNFFTFDRQLSRSTEQAQHTLMEVVQVAFSCFGDCLKGELEQTLPAIISAGPEAGEMEVVEDFVIKRLPPKLGNVTHVLTLAMSVLRRCRVNTTITIFIFSQLFQFIGSWVFNCVVLDQRLRLCSSDWGRRLRLRLQQIMMWSEKQGLEKAAECHLAKAMQLCLLLECRKSDLLQILPKLDLINSVQLHAILSNFIYTQDDPPPSRETMDRAIRMVASTVDYDVVAERGEPGLPEPLDLHLPVARVFPKDGFSCDSVVGVPQGLLEFVEGFSRMGIGAFSLNPNSSGLWNVYLDGNVQPTEVEEAPPIIQEVIQVTLHKVRNSLGLSIVAAQGEGQRDKGIYIKSVVPSGAADLDGRIETGDQLIEVGGRSLIGVTQEKAAEMMSQSGQVVNLKVLKKAAMHHGLAALLTSDPSRQKKSSNNQSNRTKVQNPDSDLSSSSLTVAKHAFNPDNDRSQSSLSWKQDESMMQKEGPYGRLPLNPAQPARIPFNHGMQSSHSDPNLINPDDSYLRVRPKISGPKKFEDGVSSLEAFSEPKHGVKNVADQLRSSSLAQGLPYQLPSPLTEVYHVKPAYGNPNQNIPSHPATNGGQDPIYAKFGRSDSPMGSVQFSDAPPIKFNPALPASKPPRPSSAVIPLSKGPGYATQMLFPKATPQSQQQQQPNVRVSPAIFSQNAFNHPPSSQNQNYSTISSNTDFLIENANQSSEIYQSRSQIQPKLNTSSDYDFPPPPPDVQLAQLKVSSSASVQPRPFETIQSDVYESSHLTKNNQNEMNLPLVESSTNQKKPPPVATKPKITPSDLKSVTLSKSPWEKEAREKEEEEMMKRKRKDEMRRLESRPYLSQEEQMKLKKLQTEEEFDQRAMQAIQENQDVDTPIRTFPPNIGYMEQSSNLFTSERQQNQNYGPSRTGQAPFEQPSRQPPVNYNNPIGYGHQEEQPIMLQYDPYRSREELQMAARFPPSKQFDNISQSSLNTTLTGAMKKTVTFNENVGVNEYPVLRSYGSTSSDGSLVQSFDQSFSGNYSDDHSPNSTFQRSISSQPVFLPKLDQDRNMYANNNQVSYEYKPKFTPEPLYAPRPPNPSLSYPYRPPPQSNTQPRQAPPMVYPYRPPATVVNAQRPITNPPVQGRRVLDPTYVQRTALQENPYSRNKSYGNYSHE